MKIAVLSSHTPSLFWFRVEMMTAFQEAGHSVVAIGNESEAQWIKRFADNGISYRQAKVERNGSNPFHDVKTLNSIRKVLREEKPEKIFTYQAKTVIYGGLAAKLEGIDEIYSLIAGVGSILMAEGRKHLLKRAVMHVGYAVSLRYSKKVFFQNQDDKDYFILKRLVSPQKVVIINGSGVNVDKFIPTELPQIPTFLFIGRLIRDKGIQEYLDACRHVKRAGNKVRCLLVGPFDTNPSSISPNELDSYIQDGTVEYFGEQTDVRLFLRQCSIFVLPSYHEGTPKTVLEAMACGRAIITTDASGCRDTVTNGENGYLVPPKNVLELAGKMKDLSNSLEKVNQMGLESRRVAETRYDVNIVNRDICKAMGI